MQQNPKSKLGFDFFDKPLESNSRYQYHNLVDVLFVIDATGSMSWCMSQLKGTVKQIMANFSIKQFNIKFALQLYRDHPPEEFSFLEKHFDLRNQAQILQVIQKNCQVQGGGDIPEAVVDGLVNGLKKTNWRVGEDGKIKSKRFLFHGCDAPPHGAQYGGKSTDITWSQSGCPCGLKREDIKNLLDEHNVQYYLIKCGKQADIMSQLFKQCFKDKFIGQLSIQKQNKTQGPLPKGKPKSSISKFVFDSIKISLRSAQHDQ